MGSATVVSFDYQSIDLGHSNAAVDTDLRAVEVFVTKVDLGPSGTDSAAVVGNLACNVAMALNVVRDCSIADDWRSLCSPGWGMWCLAAAVLVACRLQS